jgi:probable phosphoglycerate mutase
MLSERIIGWLATVARPTVVVAHGGVGRVLRSHLLGIDKLVSVAEDFPQDRVFLWSNGAGTWL